MAHDDIWARPRIGDEIYPLDDHLEEVASFMEVVGDFDADGDSAPAAVARTVARLHDFGKVTPQFQQYLRNEYVGERKYTYHARIGALVTFHAVRRLGVDRGTQLAACLAVARHHGATPDAVEYIFEDVYRSEREGRSGSWVGQQVAAIDETNACTAAGLFDDVPGDSSWSSFRTAFDDGTLLEALADLVSEHVGFGDGNERDRAVDRLPQRTYDVYLEYWGALTIADKTSAAGLDEADLRIEPLPLAPLDDHIAGITADDELEAELNALRGDARQSVCENVDRLLTGADVGRITLPTGLGKTFTGISAAFELRDELHDRRGLAVHPTVVYALPYTSIIEQTRGLFESDEIWGADPRSASFGVHHYLTETVTDPDTESADGGEPETDAYQPPAALLGESWRSGTMVTTFVQLFESLAGPTNGESLKLPALENAVVILDEPQALPLEWWPVIPRLVEIITDQFDGKVLAMTATQPDIFQRAGTAVEELVSDPDRYFGASERVTYDIDDSVWNFPERGTETPLVSHEAAARRVRKRVLDAADRRPSGLAICNTIASCRQLTESLVEDARERGHSVTCIGTEYRTVLEAVHAERDTVKDVSDAVVTQTLQQLGCEYDVATDSWVATEDVDDLLVCAFNSRYRPIDRRALIDIADSLTTNAAPFVMVATQAVEAGVDLSFTAVWRDIAPLDSIVQAAGRCNRSFEWGTEAGDVTVWWLADPDDPTVDTREEPPPSERIYDLQRQGWLSTVADTLRSSLPGQTAVPEVEMTRSAVPTYFDDLQVKDIRGLVAKVDDFEGESLGEESLIAQDYRTVDVLIGVTENERDRIQAIGDHFEKGDRPAAYELLDVCSDYRISIPVRDADADLAGLPRIDRQRRGTEEGVNVLAFTGSSGARYDLATGGFVVEDATVSNRFTT